MVKKFLLMTQQPALVEQIKLIAQKAQWQVEQVTTPTGLVVKLDGDQYHGVWWDLTNVNLDTTIATVTLIRDQVTGPIMIMARKLTNRVIQKLYQARVDDVILLPFHGAVLTAQTKQRLWVYSRLTRPKVVAMEHNHPLHVEDQQQVGEWKIDEKNYLVTKHGQQIQLTPKEFQLLTYLVNNRGQVLSRDQLVNGVWGYNLLETSRIVDIHISHLRDKLEDDSQHPVHLLTVRGFGYKLV